MKLLDFFVFFMLKCCIEASNSAYHAVASIIHKATVSYRHWLILYRDVMNALNFLVPNITCNTNVIVQMGETKIKSKIDSLKVKLKCIHNFVCVDFVLSFVKFSSILLSFCFRSIVWIWTSNVVVYWNMETNAWSETWKQLLMI